MPQKATRPTFYSATSDLFDLTRQVRIESLRRLSAGRRKCFAFFVAATAAVAGSANLFAQANAADLPVTVRVRRS
jgi:hypothetical protein